MSTGARLEGLLGECAAATSRRDFNAATRKLKAAEKIAADDPRVLMARAILSIEKGFPGAAVPVLQRLDRAYPDNAHILDNLGVALSLNGDIDGGLQALARAARLAPDDPTVQLDYAKLLVEKDDMETALGIYRRLAPAMGVDPTFMNNFGWALRLSGDVQGAIELLQQAADAHPTNALIMNNLGLSHEDAGDYEAAIACFRKCTVLAPDHAGYFGNLGGTLRQAGHFEDAVAAGRAAVALAPGDAYLHLRLAGALLMLERFDEGWPEYAFRTKLWGRDGFRPLGNRIWTGEPVPGKTLLVRAEQGPGDQNVFSSFFPRLAVACRDMCVIVECDRRLVPSFSRTFPEFEFIGLRRAGDPEPYPPTDYEIAMGDIPALYCRSIEDIQPVRKLIADPALTERWRREFAALGTGKIVGIAWRGGMDTVTKRKRSVTLDDLSPLFAVENCQFVNLQYGNVEAEIAAFETRTGARLHRWEGVDPLSDLETQIAQIEALDIVVQASNTSAHIAGALHKRTLMLQAYSPYWVWFLRRTTAPWYPTLTQYRAASGEDWSAAVDEAVSALRNFTLGETE